MPRRLEMPVARMASITGRTLAANWSACAICTSRPMAAAAGAFTLVAERGFACPALGQCRLRPFRDQPALLLGQCRVEVQHEGIGVGPQVGDQERHPLRHQPGDEGDVAR